MRRHGLAATSLGLTFVLVGVGVNAAEPSLPSAAAAPAATTGAAPAEIAPIDLDDIELGGVTRAAPEAARSEAWRIEGLGLLHFADGVGGGAQLRGGPFGLRATAAYETMFFIADDNTEDTKLGSFEFASGLQLNVDTLLVFGADERGASIGYRYNTVLGHGGAVAYQSVFEAWGQRFAFSVPIIYFPQGTERAHKQLGLSSQEKLNYPFGAGLQYGMGVAWMF